MRMPGPREERAILARASTMEGSFFSLQADVSKAHRRFLYRRQDWGLLACRLSEGHVWINKVGTFGVGSAGYWWGRLAGIVMRCALSLMFYDEVWVTLFADDLKVSARQLPASAFGYFIASTTPGSVFPVSNSVGTLCVIGSIGPGVGGGTVNSGPDGFFYGSVDLNAMPQPVGTVMVQPGDTWHFQAWYRDAFIGIPISNLTDGLALTFL